MLLDSSARRQFQLSLLQAQRVNYFIHIAQNSHCLQLLRTDVLCFMAGSPENCCPDRNLNCIDLFVFLAAGGISLSANLGLVAATVIIGNIA